MVREFFTKLFKRCDMPLCSMRNGFSHHLQHCTQVVPDKVDMVREYFTKLLKRWDIPLLGVIPDEPYLGRPSLMDLEKIFKTKVG
jgi:hypothetical protein